GWDDNDTRTSVSVVWFQDDRQGEPLIDHEASDGKYLVCGAECPVEKRGASDVLARSRETLKNVELRFANEPAGEDRWICHGKDRHTFVLRHQVGNVREYRRQENSKRPELPSCSTSPCREHQPTAFVSHHSKTHLHNGRHDCNRYGETEIRGYGCQ